MRHFGVTGTKEPLTLAQQQKILPIMRSMFDHGFSVQHNGDCINADHTLACAWRRVGGNVWGHPPSNPQYRAWFAFDNFGHMENKEYRTRNFDIVQASEMLVALPKTMNEEQRSGTWMTVRMARDKGIPILYIWPNGTTTWDNQNVSLRI